MKSSNSKYWLLILFAVCGCHTSNPSPSSTFFVGLSGPPTTLDPRFATDANSIRITDLIFSTLIRLGNDYKPIPDAAFKWEITKNKIVFHLRKDLVFHDGRPVTLEDVQASFNEYRKTSSPFASVLHSISNVEIKDPDQLIFILNQYDASLFSNLTDLKILPQRNISDPQFALNPIGSGPFRFMHWTNNEILLRREKSSSTLTSEIAFKFIRDENTRYLKMIKGEIDVLINELQEEKIRDIRKHSNVNVLLTPGLNFNYILLNLHDDKLRNIEVRRALYSAIDKKSVIQFKLEGLAFQAFTILAPSNPFFDNQIQRYDKKDTLEEAKAIIERFLPGNTHLSLKSSDQAIDNGEVLAEQISSSLKLKIDHQSFEWGTFYSDVKAGRFQMALMRWVGIIDPDVYRDTLSSQEFAPSGRNRGFYSNSELDSLVEKARMERDETKRREIYTKVQRLVLQDLPILPLWYNMNMTLLSPRVRNFMPSITGSFLPLVAASKD